MITSDRNVSQSGPRGPSLWEGAKTSINCGSPKYWVGKYCVRKWINGNHWLVSDQVYWPSTLPGIKWTKCSFLRPHLTSGVQGVKTTGCLSPFYGHLLNGNLPDISLQCLRTLTGFFHLHLTADQFIAPTVVESAQNLQEIISGSSRYFFISHRLPWAGLDPTQAQLDLLGAAKYSMEDSVLYRCYLCAFWVTGGLP